MNRTDSLTVLGYDLECYHLGIIPSVELPSGLVDGYLEICRRSRLSIRRWARGDCTANFSLGSPDLRKGLAIPDSSYEPPPIRLEALSFLQDGPIAPPSGRTASPHYRRCVNG